MIRFLLGFSSVLLVAVSLAASAHAQVTVGGVDIDAEGVLRTSRKPDSRLAELRKASAGRKQDEALVYVSLPRIFAEARRLQEAGEPLPDAIRFLGGMVKLQYVFVYPDEKDLVLAGRVEPFDEGSEYRPLGRVSGRPVLQLNDLVAALRACGPGRSASLVGCDLEMTEEVADRIRKKTKEIQGRISSIGERKASEEIAAAGGSQPVKYYGIETNTRFAVVCIEADYELKRLQLGLLDSPTPKVRSYVSQAGPPEKPHRFAFECAYDELAASPDGNAFELRGPSLRVGCSRYSIEEREDEKGKVSPAAGSFARQCSENFDRLSRDLLSFADLANLSDLAVTAALIGRDGLHEKAGWDVSWVMDGYRATPMTAPRAAQTLCVCRHAGAQIVFVSGGVDFDPAGILGSLPRKESASLRDASLRPDGADWSRSRPLR